MENKKQCITKLIKKYGELYSEQLGIKLSKNDREIFKWFLAAMFYGKRISENIASNTYLSFYDHKLVTPKAIIKAGWDELVRVLGIGGYVRYDFSTATKLLKVCDKLEKEYQGSLNKLHDKAKDPDELEALLAEFDGIGPVTTNIFLREMRAFWAKANPPPLPIIIKTAKTLGIDIQGMIRKTKSFMRLECALFRVRKIADKNLLSK